MIITKEILEANGFTSNHPEYVFLGNDGWRITVRQTYYPASNKLGWDIYMYNVNIQKRIQAAIIETVEDLNSLINICEIPNLIYAEPRN